MRLFISTCVLITLVFSNVPVALITKIRGDIKYKNIDTDYFLESLVQSSPIYLESQILVDKKSFAKIVFLDDGSTILIYPETEILIKGNVDRKNIKKRIELIYGQINIDVVSKFDYEFVAVSPSSKLTCNSCNFWLLSNASLGDKFIKNDGDISIYNSSINQSHNLGLDTTLISFLDTDFIQYRSTVNEVKYLESLMLEYDEKILESRVNNENNTSTSIKENIVLIKLRNAANVEKEIILRYTN